MRVFRAVSTCLAALLALACASCATSEIVVPTGAPTAQLQFVAYPGFAQATYYTRPDLQLLWSVANPRCKPRLAMKLVGTQSGFDPMKAPVAIESGKRMYLDAMTNQAMVTGRTSCVSVASFMPETGHAYEAYHLYDVRSCRLIVIDKATGAPPASFEEHPVVHACR